MPSASRSRISGLCPEDVQQNTAGVTWYILIGFFAGACLVLTIVAVNYESNEAFFHPSAKMTDLIQPISNANPNPDDSDADTGMDLLASNHSNFVNCGVRVNDPVDCSDSDVFLLLMNAALEKFRDIEFYRFGKPVRGNDFKSCHMAWTYKSKGQSRVEYLKDYRNFALERTESCSFSLLSIGDYHSGENARKWKSDDQLTANPISLPESREDLKDAFYDLGSQSSFRQGKYLIYSGGGDRCKNIHHYLWSFLCMLGEAQYLNRTLVMDLSFCLSKIHSSSGQDEEGKDFRFYFDFEHLLDSTPVIEQFQFWSNWNRLQKKDELTLHLVEDHVNVTPMSLVEVNDTLIMRKFRNVEPSGYWFQVCEGQAEQIIDRPWSMIWKSRPLLDVASAIIARMKWDFDAVHIERGQKANNTDLWPNVDRDTSPDSLLDNLRDKIDSGRELYIVTDEANTSFFDPLKSKYSTHFLDEHKDLWDVNSDWYIEMEKLNNGKPVEFDEFMKASVDSEVLSQATRKIETFNDLTKDCKDGINTCEPSN